MKRAAFRQEVNRSSVLGQQSLHSTETSCGCGYGFVQTQQHNQTDDYGPDVDSLIAKELIQLSLQERNAIQEEIHGVVENTVVEENPELIESKLIEFQEALDKTRKKSAFDLAVFLNPRYVEDRNRRIMFLRGEQWDAVRAARRYIKFFDGKLELWGQDRLVRDITWDDLDEDDREAVLAGSMFYTNFRDRSGRALMFNMIKYEKFKNWRNQTRSIWYQIMDKCQDEDVQRKGFVNITFFMGSSQQHPETNRQFLSKGVPLLLESLPSRNACFHGCYNSKLMQPLIQAFHHLVGPSNRIRFRPHFGSYMECFYSLLSFGIPRTCIPITDSGELDFEVLHQHFHERRQAEIEREMIRTPDLFPLSSDVLLGRGRRQQEFPGNVRLALLVDEHRAQYFTSNRAQKRNITYKIVWKIRQDSRRFLKKSEDGFGWEEVDDETAREKVGHGFRTKTSRSAGPNSQVRPSASADTSTSSFSGSEEEEEVVVEEADIQDESDSHWYSILLSAMMPNSRTTAVDSSATLSFHDTKRFRPDVDLGQE